MLNRCCSRTIRAALLTLLLVLTVGVTANATIGFGTIVLKSGERLEKVNFKVDSYYKVLKVQLEGDERYISLDEIESVLDDEGQDITNAVLNGVSSESADGLVSRDSEAYRAATRPKWTVTLCPMVGYGLAAGDYYEGLKGGLSFGGAIAIAASNKVSIRIGVGRAGLEWDDDYRLYSYDPNLTIVSQDFSMNAMRYYAAAQAHFYMDHKGDKLSMTYIYAGLGAVSHSARAEVTLRNNTTQETVPGGTEYSETKFMMPFGVGMTTMTSPNVGIDFGLEWDMVFAGSYEHDGYNEIQYAHLFDFHAGLIFYL